MIAFDGLLAQAGPLIYTSKTDWDVMGPRLWDALGQTLQMVSTAMLIGGFFGLTMGIALYITRKGGLAQQQGVNFVLNLLVNLVRPIPFVIFLAALGPLSRQVVGTAVGNPPVVFAMCIMASFAFSRLVEQNLVALDPGVIEAARAMGASKLRVIFTVMIPEALGPLILAYTFLFIGVVDMSAMAQIVGGGGLGAFAIQQGYQRFNWELTYVVVLVIIVLVQLAQFLGNTLARKVMRR